MDKYLKRFLNKILFDPNGCWVWTAGKAKGYAVFFDGTKQVRGHRYAYSRLVEEIPEGLELDHKCRNKACVNPSHLEPVTHLENLMRSPVGACSTNAAKTHCKHGHPFNEQNTWISARGQRQCKACHRIRDTKYRQERSA